MPILAAGDRLGPYEIRAPIGAGGMGEVYRAIDPRLGREVAIKVSAAEFGERFEREARAVAALNHPNICTLYDVGPNYLVMEVVEGPTLADRIKQGALPPEEAIGIALQVAEALAAAHERGIVHRDLKPANIKIKPDGTAKVLDFGLAQVSRSSEAAREDSPTVTATLTESGTILGTAAYMAPEQAEGKPVDRRADIWAFGVVLHEMLTGKRLFTGDTLAATLAAVLTKDPDLNLAPARTRRLLKRCLERDPRRRLRDIAEAQYLLEERTTTAPASSSPLVPWAIAGVLALAFAIALWAPWRTACPPERPSMRLNVDLGPDAVVARNFGAAISPDGTRLAFTARTADGKRQLATRVLEQPQSTLFAGTDGANDPFFSPDGKWIGFFANGQMKKISVQGGAAVTITNTSGAFGATWGEDQNIVFTPASVAGLWYAPSSGGTPKELTRIAEKEDGTHRWPQVLPGGRAVLFTSHKIIAGFDDARIEAVITRTGERKTLLRGGYFGRYVDYGGKSGYLIYVHEGTVFGVAFDPVALEVHGAPVPLIENVAADVDTGAGQFDLSSHGIFVYQSGKGPSRTWPVLWLDSSGKTEPLVAELGTYYTPRFSPDGKRLALTVDHGDQGREIEVYDLARGNFLRLTSSREVNLFPVWTPDGKYIVYESSSPKGGYGIALVPADGSGKVQRLLEHTGLMIPHSFSPDGRRMAYDESNPGSGSDIWTVPIDTSNPEHATVGKPEPFLNTPASDWHPAFSPDGRWIGHSSNESGPSEVYVRPFPGPGSKVKISTGGGNSLTWAPNGRDLYFKSPDGRIMIAGYTVKGDSFIATKPRVWSDTRPGGSPFGREVALSPDGKRFAVFPPREVLQPAGSVHLTFVLNFADELRRKFSPPK